MAWRASVMWSTVSVTKVVLPVDLLHDIRVLLDEKHPILLDVGANIGQTIKEFLETFRTPRIFSFEPSPETFLLLRQNYAHLSNVQLENVALGDREGTLPFYVTKDYSVNDSLLRPNWNSGAREVPIQVCTVDGYCNRLRIREIDLLKIDTQGNDANVLRGAPRMLKDGKIRLFYVEVMFTPMYEEQAGFTC
jgi:FkbM family methyltransferase